MISHPVFVNIFLAIPIITCMSTIDSFNDDDGSFRIPLVRTKSGLEKLMEMGVDDKLLHRLLSFGSHQKKDRPNNDTLPLFKHFDSQYYGLVNIGKPGRSFRMAFDTAWSHSWVTSIDCPKFSPPCAVHRQYDHRVSSTYKANGTVFNASGELVGYMSKDVFLVGQMNSTDQDFAEISKLPWVYSLLAADGVVGLGLKGASPGFLPFFYNFYQQNTLKRPVFSVYLNRDSTTEHGGSILFGTIDKKRYKGEFTTVNVISSDYWIIQVQKVNLVISSKKAIEFCKNGCTAIADTSANTIVGPPDDIKSINTLIGASGTIFKRAMIPCVLEHKGPKVNFTIADHNFTVLGRDYVQKMSYDGVTVCLSAFQEADASSSAISNWRLGGAFLYQYYSVFDVRSRKIMLAEAA